MFHFVQLIYWRIYFYFIFNKGKIKIPFKNTFQLSKSNINELVKIDKNNYEEKVLEFLKKKSVNKSFFIDIGAHYGFYTFNLQTHFKKIYAFEANPLNLEILKYNINNINKKKIKTINSFVGEKDEKINFLLSNFSFISQFDKKSVLTDELNEFCKDGFYYTNKKDLDYIKEYCYKNFIIKKNFKNFLYIFSNLLKNINNLNIIELKKKLSLVLRYNFHYERYVCERTRVKSIKFDNYFKKKMNKSLIKIDVEGAEKEVLNGAKKFIEKNKPEIFCEIGHNHKQVINLILKMGYKYKKINWKSYYFYPAN